MSVDWNGQQTDWLMYRKGAKSGWMGSTKDYLRRKKLSGEEAPDQAGAD